MNSSMRTGLICLALIAPAFVAARDALDDAKARLKIEAERIEREFTSLRAAAYRAVRSDTPRLSDALDRLDEIERLLQNDTALKADKKASFQATLKYDQSRIREIAGERRRVEERSRVLPSVADRRPTSSSGSSPAGSSGRVAEDRRESLKDVEKLMAGRSKLLTDTRKYRREAGEGRLRVYKSVDDSAMPESRDTTFPPNWKELSERRSSRVKMTAKEKAIMASLERTLKLDFEKANFQDVLDYLRKATGMAITVDRKAMESVGATYDSPVTFRNETSTRTAIKQICANLDLTYVIKDESIYITSRAVANTMTVTRTYYLGDLVGLADVRLDPVTNQLLMLERVNGLISMITNKVDRGTWAVNNPDSSGAITFYPPSMTLIVKQTAEFHFRFFGSR